VHANLDVWLHVGQSAVVAVGSACKAWVPCCILTVHSDRCSQWAFKILAVMRSTCFLCKKRRAWPQLHACCSWVMQHGVLANFCLQFSLAVLVRAMQHAVLACSSCLGHAACSPCLQLLLAVLAQVVRHGVLAWVMHLCTGMAPLVE